MASPIGHSLFAAAIFLATRNRMKLQPRRVWAGQLLGAAFLANLIDCDFLVGFVLSAKYHHRHMHSFAFGLTAAVAVTGGFWLWRALRKQPLRLNTTLSMLALTSLLICSHLIIDTFTADTSAPYGSMLFWPVTERYFISPLPLFLDVWRGSVLIAFGYHNLSMVLREIAIGGAVLAAVLAGKRYPRRWIVAVTAAALSFIVIDRLTVQTLRAKGEQQMTQWLGELAAPSGLTVEGAEQALGEDQQRGIIFSGKHDGQQAIYRIFEDGSGMARLTDGGAADMPAWAPDGSQFAFQREIDGQWDIAVAHADGSNERRLTSDPALDESPSWMSNGKQLLFSSNRTGTFEIYIMNSDGSQPQRLTGPDATIDVLPAAAPHGADFVYASRLPLVPVWHIYRSAVNQQEPPVRVSPLAGCRAKWSPDARYLAFVSDGDYGTTDIWIFHAAGGHPRRVTATPEYDYDPCWSPDGQRICFARGAAGKSGWRLWIVNIDGTGLRPLSPAGMEARQPSWR